MLCRYCSQNTACKICQVPLNPNLAHESKATFRSMMPGPSIPKIARECHLQVDALCRHEALLP